MAESSAPTTGTDPVSDNTSSKQRNGTNDVSPQQRLLNLTAKATALYGVKDYNAAAEVYSEATELQAEINGEMNIENADLLYAYGRCLFFVAQRTSTVLGGTAAQTQLSGDNEKKATKKRKADGTSKANGSSAPAGASSTAPNVISTSSAADVVPESEIKTDGHDTAISEQKPLFQITGDGNWTDSEDEEEGEGDENEEEEEDDFENSFELLDLARVLYLRKLESMQERTAEELDKGKYVASIDLTPPVRDLKARIADIYDLQAEIGLEGEKFSAAVSDLKSCLVLKEELEAPESSILAECHYKLSLALEAAAQDQERDADGNPVGEITINWDVRNEAVLQQEKAIDCCKLRVSKETKNLESIQAGEAQDKAMAQIEDVQEMIGEMDDRLAELRKPPVSVKAETENDANKDMMAGVLGQIMGASGKSKEEQKEQLAKVMAAATDLSGMVRKKKPKNNSETASNASGTGSKRKVEFVDEVADSSAGKTKKAKVEETEDSGL